MNDNSRDFLNMAGKVVTFRNSHAADLDAANPDASPLIDQIETKIDEALANDTVSTEDNSGFAISKNSERVELDKCTRRGVSALIDLCTGNHNVIMLQKINYTKSDLAAMSDLQFFEAAEKVYDIAQSQISSLTPKGYTSAHQLTFNTHLTAFKPMKGVPREVKGEAAIYTGFFEKNIAEIRELLRLLDIKMNLLEFDHEELYLLYYSARNTDNTGSGGDGMTTVALNPSQDKKAKVITYQPDLVININVSGNQAVEISLRNDDGSTTFGAPLTYQPGDVAHPPMADLAPEGSTIWARNISTTSPTEVKISLG